MVILVALYETALPDSGRALRCRSWLSINRIADGEGLCLRTEQIKATVVIMNSDL